MKEEIHQQVTDTSLPLKGVGGSSLLPLKGDWGSRALIYIIMCMLPLCAAAQKKENHNSAISRNLELFNDIYKQLDLFYVDSLNADTVIGWGIRSMLQQVDPFTDYYPDDDEDLRQMATGKYAGIGSIIRYHRKEQRAVISEPSGSKNLIKLTSK